MAFPSKNAFHLSGVPKDYHRSADFVSVTPAHTALRYFALVFFYLVA
jgi:hypothetical protein